MRDALDVGIVGSGTAGAASALLLARAGHRVTLYDQFEEPRPVGAGIVLQPTGLAILARLGLAERVIGRGARLGALRCQTARGATLFHLLYERVAPALYGLGIHRGALFEALFDAVRAQSGITLRLGVTVQALADASGPRPALVDERGERHGPHDLVVVANGARSTLRDGAAATVREYPWGALWFVARDPERVFRDELHQVAEGTQRFMGLLPTGLGPVAGGDEPLVSLFWSVRADQVDAWRAQGLPAWKKEIVRYDPRAALVADQIDSLDQVLFARYHDVVMRAWHAPSVAFLGDAAHATSPQLGQGANLALADAAALADAIDGADGVARALAAYTRSRRAHLAFYQRATRWLTPFFQSDSRLAGLLRDTLMKWSARVPWMRGQMVRTMCGVKVGFLSRSMPLAPIIAALPRVPPGA